MVDGVESALPGFSDWITRPRVVVWVGRGFEQVMGRVRLTWMATSARQNTEQEFNEVEPFWKSPDLAEYVLDLAAFSSEIVITE